MASACDGSRGQEYSLEACVAQRSGLLVCRWWWPLVEWDLQEAVLAAVCIPAVGWRRLPTQQQIRRAREKCV